MQEDGSYTGTLSFRLADGKSEKPAQISIMLKKVEKSFGDSKQRIWERISIRYMIRHLVFRVFQHNTFYQEGKCLVIVLPIFCFGLVGSALLFVLFLLIVF